jgi:hypothetical protein
MRFHLAPRLREGSRLQLTFVIGRLKHSAGCGQSTRLIPRCIAQNKRRPADIEGGVLSSNRGVLQAVPLSKPPASLCRKRLQPVHHHVQPEPHHVDKVPVPGSAFERKVMIRREVPPNHAYEHDSKHRAAEEHVETVETCQQEEG